jgi:aldose 1-epimerase
VTPDGAGGAGPIVLARDDATLRIDPAQGGRIASLVVGGHELLITEAHGPLWWGCYPMAPFAGRIRDGRFRFQGRRYQLPLSMPPNAIHGTVLDRPWEVAVSSDERVDLSSDLALVPGGLEATLTVEASEPMPVALGWHPWFRREIAGSPAFLDFEAHWMYERDRAGLPTGATVAPTPRPWDDAFSDVVIPPRLTWPGVVRLDIRSTAAFWVVFDERDDAICVEPQTAPPDAFNLAAAVGVDPPMAAPDRPASVAMAWRWDVLAPRPAREQPAPAKRATTKRPTPSKRPRSGQARSRR